MAERPGVVRTVKVRISAKAPIGTHAYDHAGNGRAAPRARSTDQHEGIKPVAPRVRPDPGTAPDHHHSRTRRRSGGPRTSS